MHRLIVGGELFLFGPVGMVDLFDDSGFTASDVVAALSELRGDISVRLNSAGGVAMEGSAIYNALQRHKGRITIKIDGIAASAASVIAMAGDVIEMPTGTLMMIHEPSGVTVGTSTDHRSAAGVLETMTGVFAELYASRTGLTEKEIRRMMADETWLSPAEALQLGFATSAPRKASAASADATFDYRTYLSAPANLQAMAEARAAQGVPLVAMVANPNKSNRQGQKQMSMNTQNIIEDDLDQDEITLEQKPSGKRGDVTMKILTSCTAANMSAADASKIVAAAGGDFSKAQGMIINTLAERDGYGATPGFSVGEDYHAIGAAQTATTISEAIYARMSGKRAEGPASEFQGRSLLDLGGAIMAANGQRVPRNREHLASALMSGQHSTSDFASILGSSSSKYLGDAYQANETPLKAIARERDANSFRPLMAARLSEMPKLVETPEGAEIVHGTRTESVESFSVKTYTRIFSLTRQAIINDDLSAFADTLRAFGAAAAQTEASLIADLIKSNPSMEDTFALFSTDHANLGSFTTLTSDNLATGRKALRNMKGLDGVTPLNLSPAFLVVSADMEAKAESVLANISAATADNVNLFAGKLDLLVDPRLETGIWRLFASPAQAAVLEIAYLNGVRAPILEQRDGWNVLGTEFRAVLDFGAGITGWRGAYQSNTAG